MKIAEKTLIVLALIGLILNLVSNTGVIFILAMSSLAVLYFYTSFALFNDVPLKGILKKASYESTNKKRVSLSFAAGIGLSMICIGTLFKLMLWPTWEVQLMGGLLVLAVVGAISTFFYLRSKAAFYTALYTRLALFGLVAVILYFIPGEALVDVYFRNETEEYRALHKRLLENPNDEDARQRMEAIFEERSSKEQNQD